MANLVYLDNGMRMIVQNRKESASASMAIWIGLGSRLEELEKSGSSHLLEHLLFQGTEKRPSAKAVSESIEGIGGVINAFTGHESTCFICKVPAYRLEQAFDVLVDIILHPLFREEDVMKEKRVIIEEIKLHRDQPQDRAEMDLFELLFPNHPLGTDIAGSEESLRKLELASVRGLWSSSYCAQNMVIALCGNIDEERVEELTRKYFAPLAPGKRPLAKPVSDLKQNRFRVEKKDTAEAHLCLGGIAYDRFSRKKHSLDLLNAILGVGASSRLYQEIRDKRGLAYYVHSSLDYFQDTGCQVIEASCDPSNVPQVLELIWTELEKIKEEGVPPDELERVKEFLKGGFVLRLEDTLAHALWLGEKVLHENRIPSIKQEVKKYEIVSVEEVQRVAKEIFRCENYSGVVVGPLEDDRCFQGLRLSN